VAAPRRLLEQRADASRRPDPPRTTVEHARERERRVAAAAAARERLLEPAGCLGLDRRLGANGVFAPRA
jgi:hypothetical protein